MENAFIQKTGSLVVIPKSCPAWRPAKAVVAENKIENAFYILAKNDICILF